MGPGQETILITGGYGFVGCNLIRHFKGRSSRIVVLSPESCDEFTSDANIQHYQTDMTDSEELEKIIVGENPHYILHLAGVVTAIREKLELKIMTASNLQPLINVLESSKRSARLRLFLNFGSAEEYGPVPVPFSEDQIERPQSPYALAKLFNSRTVAYFADQQNIPAITIRPGLIYGPDQPTEKFLPSVILAALKGESITMTEGLQTRDFIYVKDLARIVGILMAYPFESFGGVYNAGTGVETTLMEVVEMVLRITGSTSAIERVLPYREKESMRFVCSTEKISTIIGDSFPWTPLSEGLEKTINHYRETSSD